MISAPRRALFGLALLPLLPLPTQAQNVDVEVGTSLIATPRSKCSASLRSMTATWRAR